MAVYETFASVYDAIMDNSLYEKWTDFSLRHFPEGKKNLLELACGTGIQSLCFKEAGFDVTGLDLSQEMLETAKKRSKAAGLEIPFVQGNMLDLSSLGQFDLVTCYSDSLCYMEDEVELGQVFTEVYQHLHQGGIFFFDVHSIYQIDEVFPTYSYHENAEDFAFVWDSYADEAPHSIVHELTFFVKEEDGRFTRFDEVHEERTYQILTYQVLLEEAGFTDVAVYADFTDETPQEKSQRWFFKAKKE